MLSDLLGEQVVTASIPGGWGSREVHASAAAAGIRALFTPEPLASRTEVDGCMLLGRYTIKRSTPARTAAAMAAGKVGPRALQLAAWRFKDLAKAIGGERYVSVRDAAYEPLVA